METGVVACRYKWDVVRSVLKSMAGLQRGKVAELERGRGPLARITAAAAGAANAAAAHHAELAAGLARGGALRANIKTLLGIGKGRREVMVIVGDGNRHERAGIMT
jgi:hypothetical protein